MINKSETEALRRYLASERLWLLDVQREMGGRIYLETLGEKMVTALVVAYQGGDEATIDRGLASFDMVFGMAGEYALTIKDEAAMLQSFLVGFRDSMVYSGIQIGELPKGTDFDGDRTAAFVAGATLARHLRVVMVWTDAKWAVKNLREQIALVESSEEVHLQKFVAGIRSKLVRRGILENEIQETI
ncbi:hypothetical protein HYU91_00045 [Candidatus Collierbacteria bacterium]|nr:hypothetical protein [Candidatus Collierbacteria bacterium]